MLTRNTTLVLGAGASVAMGYPVGEGLRKAILKITGGPKSAEALLSGLYVYDIQHLAEFSEQFKVSQLDSIDRFLAKRPELVDIGKLAIASVLVQCENAIELFANAHNDLWYRYMFNLLAADSWDDLDFSHLSIITFNYDRSLEHYLLWALVNAYGRTQEEVIEKLKTLRVVHIYGTLGKVWPGEPGYYIYGAEFSEHKVKAAAESIRIIPEGRSDDEVLKVARGLLENADAIAFLGFGFDQTNLHLLGAPRTCREFVKREGFSGLRPVVATCKGLTAAEASSARERATGYSDSHPGSRDYPRTHVIFRQGSDCLSLLRETLILE